jgi:hypothetical protein
MEQEHPLTEASIDAVQTASQKEIIRSLEEQMGKGKSFVTKIDTANFELESLIDSDEFLTVMPAFTVYEDFYSRLISIKM